MTRVNPRQTATRKKALNAGMRSGFELKVANQLKRARISYVYEPSDGKLTYSLKSRGRCVVCGSHDIIEEKQYLPDFVIGNIILESKGRFTAANRKSMISVKENNPDRIFVMLFMSNNKLSPKSKKRYSDWCEQHGFIYFLDNTKWIPKLKELIKNNK